MSQMVVEYEMKKETKITRVRDVEPGSVVSIEGLFGVWLVVGAEGRKKIVSLPRGYLQVPDISNNHCTVHSSRFIIGPEVTS